jgi:chemotaxis-related protein WspD
MKEITDRRTPLTVTGSDCWNRIGVWGDRTCPELARVVHCHNCPVFAAAGQRFLDALAPEGYQEEWTRRLAAPEEELAAELHGVLIFRLGEEWLALAVQALAEVTSPRPVHRVPHRGGPLAGLVNIRGELHLCVRLAEVLGVRGADALAEGAAVSLGGRRGHARFLVARRESDSWVFPVDEVDQVHRLRAAELLAVPSTVGRALAHLSRGVFAWQGRSVGWLDEAKLFGALRARLR